MLRNTRQNMYTKSHFYPISKNTKNQINTTNHAKENPNINRIQNKASFKMKRPLSSSTSKYNYETLNINVDHDYIKDRDTKLKTFFENQVQRTRLQHPVEQYHLQGQTQSHKNENQNVYTTLTKNLTLLTDRISRLQEEVSHNYDQSHTESQELIVMTEKVENQNTFINQNLTLLTDRISRLQEEVHYDQSHTELQKLIVMTEKVENQNTFINQNLTLLTDRISRLQEEVSHNYDQIHAELKQYAAVSKNDYTAITLKFENLNTFLENNIIKAVELLTRNIEMICKDMTEIKYLSLEMCNAQKQNDEVRHTFNWMIDSDLA